MMKNDIPNVEINVERLMQRINTLAEMTEPGRPYTRRAFTDLYQRARDWLKGEFSAADLDVHLDAGANLIGERQGKDENAPTIALGSHIDTVEGGGRFDGIAGVVTALEAAQALSEAGIELRHRLQVIDFLSEEPSDYGASCVGSRALAGTLTRAMLKGKNSNGETLAEAIERMGGNPAVLTKPLVSPEDIAMFMELHIEQGPILEQADKPIGVVEGIVGIYRQGVRVRGAAAHAGTTPMKKRRDALVGAAKVVQRVSEKANLWATDAHFVATVGKLEVKPNGANVVPGEVQLVIEARSPRDERLILFFKELEAELTDTLGESLLTFEMELLSRADPAPCAPAVIERVETACEQRNHAYERMNSGAGHDAMQVANLAPMGMIFIPCADGISHNPNEDARPKDIAAGAEVLLDAILYCDRNEEVSTS